MRKRIWPLLCAVLVLALSLMPFGALAAPLDPAAEASLTLHYQKDGHAFPGLSVDIYRVAEALPDGSFQLIAPYTSYPVNIHGITVQEQWKHVATTLLSYIVAEGVAPTATAATDEGGTAAFAELPTGLYLVREVTAQNGEGVYLFDTFMVYLPTPGADGSFDYQVEAKPKCADFTPHTRYTVTKLWQDEGYRDTRPAQVTVAIYKDGALYHTVALNAANNWSYTWQVTAGDTATFTVAEQDVPDRYTVTVQENGGVFSILNSCVTKPDVPQTGESFSPLPWVLLMCFSGLTLLLLGLASRRRA